VPDFTPLGDLKNLDLSYNKLVDLGDLSGTNLEVLHVDGNLLTDLDNLPSTIQEATFSNNMFPTPPDLSGLPELAHLDFSWNWIDSMPSLSGHALLEFVDLSYNRIVDLSNELSLLTSLGSQATHEIYVDHNLLTEASCPEIDAMIARTNASGAIFSYLPQGNFSLRWHELPDWPMTSSGIPGSTLLLYYEFQMLKGIENNPKRQSHEPNLQTM